MSRSVGLDPYIDPASGVLRNLLGITDVGELARVEAALSASRLVIGQLAVFLADINAMHPFREGNGRTSGPFSPSSPTTLGIISTGFA